MSIANEHITTSAADLRERLALLERERATVLLTAMADHDLYMVDLLAELQSVRSAYVGTAVTEIASLRSALSSPLLG